MSSNMKVNPLTGKLDMVGDVDTTENDSLLYYTSEVPTPKAHGGIKAGATFDKMPLVQVIDQILHEPTNPTLSLETNAKQTCYEIGTSFDLTITAHVTKGSSNIAKVEFFSDNTLMETNTSLSGSGSITFKSKMTKTTTYKVVVTDANGLTDTKTLSYAFYRPIYYGVVPNTPTSVNGLTKVIPTAKSGNYKANFSAFSSKRFVFAIYGSVSKVLNPSLFDITGNIMDVSNGATIDVLCADGQTLKYNVYYSDINEQTKDYPVTYTYSLK